ncbi:MAG: trehalose-phosphatase [Hyphomicrobiales bacterium]
MTRARSLFGRAATEAIAAAVAPAGRPRPRLLVVFDFDGTLAPIVRKPDAVRLPADTRRLLRRAARLPRVRVALLSARPMADLDRYAPKDGLLRLAQYGLEGAVAPPLATRRRIRRGVSRLRARLREVAARHPGAWIEDKKLSIAVHDRGLSAARRAALHRALRPVAALGRTLGFHVAPGRRVLDFVPAAWNKGRALRAVRRKTAPAVTFYFGDSESDEPAFAALGARDFAVRVGVGTTSAGYRVRSPRDMARFLRTLVRLRERAGTASRKESA